MRERLQSALEHHRVVVVTAPSGFGKTSVVSDWAASQTDPVVWLTLGAFDRESLHLDISVMRALQALMRNRTEGFDLGAFDPELGDAAAAFDAVVSAMDGMAGRAILIIDDAQIAEAELHTGFLGALIESGPEPLRMVIVGTSTVELMLNRTVLSNPDAVIRSEELAFDVAEVASVGEAAAVDLPAEAIWQETQGWPIAVRLVTMAGVKPHARRLADDALLQEYVEAHILGKLDPEFAQFVLLTSTCAELTEELAAAVSGRDDASRLLAECRKLGLFIDRFDTERGLVYRWHAIFAKQCRAVLKATNPEACVRAHQAAARYLETRDPLVAVAHWLESGDPEAAAQVLRHRWLGVLVGEYAGALDQACVALPHAFDDDPTLLLVRACAQDLMGAHELARKLYARAETVTASLPPDPIYALNLPRAQLFLLDDRAALLKVSDIVQAQLATPEGGNSFDRAELLFVLGWTEMRLRQRAVRAVELLAAAVQKARAKGDPQLAVLALSHLAMVYAWAGRFNDARSTLDEIGEVHHEDSLWWAYAGGSASVARAYLAYWNDDLELAEREALTTIRSGADATAFAGIARMLLAFTAAAMKNPHACRRASLEAREIPDRDVQGISWPAFRLTSQAVLAEVMGHKDRALAIAGRYEEVTDLPLVVVMLAGIVRRAGEPLRALKMLRRLSRFDRISYVRVAQLVTAAIAQQRLGNDELAHDLCEQALELAVDEQIRRPFCDGDLDMRQLLSGHVSWGTKYEEFIVACLAPREMSGPLALLSPRERVVCEQLRSTKTFAEIAEYLGVSMNTIKTHQRSIYRKLGVTSRREAVELMT